MSDSIEFLRKQAKQLLKHCRAANAEAIARIRLRLPRVSAWSDSELITRIKLSDVQHLVALERGVANWADLKGGTDAGLEEFLAAVRNGDADAVKRQLEKAAEDFVEENIHVACVLGDVDALAVLLEANPSLANREHEGWSPLHYACASPVHKLSKRHAAGIFKCADLLLKDSLDFTLRSIHLAQERARDSLNIALVSLLTRHGGNPLGFLNLSPGPSLLERQKREAPLPEVFQTPEFRQFLIQRKAQRPASESGIRAKKTVESMMERGEQIKALREETKKRLEEVRSRLNMHTSKFQQRSIALPPRLSRPEMPDADKELERLLRSPWIDAEIWRFALDHGLDPNWRGWSGKQTILHRLASAVSLELIIREDPGMVTKAIEIVELFLAHGAQADLPGDDGQTAYVVSIRSRNRVIAQILEKHGANKGSATPADLLVGACARTDLKEARSIVDSNAGILDTIPAQQIDFMFMLAAKGELERIQFMAELGFDLNRYGDCAATLLHIAAWHGHVDLVRLLLKFHASPNIPDIVYGCSPLAWAAHGSTNCRDGDDDYCSIVDALAANGAQYDAAMNRSGVGPEIVATSRVSDALKKNGLHRV